MSASTNTVAFLVVFFTVVFFAAVVFVAVAFVAAALLVVFFSVMMSSGISLDDRTKVCVTVIYRFKKMYFCIVILEYLHIQTKRLKFF